MAMIHDDLGLPRSSASAAPGGSVLSSGSSADLESAWGSVWLITGVGVCNSSLERAGGLHPFSSAIHTNWAGWLPFIHGLQAEHAQQWWRTVASSACSVSLMLSEPGLGWYAPSHRLIDINMVDCELQSILQIALVRIDGNNYADNCNAMLYVASGGIV